MIYNPKNNAVPIKHRTQNHHPYSIPLIIVISKIFPSIFPIVAIHTSCNIYIVTLTILVHCPLLGSSRFFLSFIKKTPQEFLVVSLFRLPQISLSSQWILHERYSFSYSFIRKLNIFSLKFFPHLDTKKI